jgi:PadR family transcriptional regulator PadR
MHKKNDILQGTLVLLVLKTLASHKRMHGYAITAHIHQVADDLLRVEEGSLYPALHRMEEAGWVRAEWGVTERNREARFYSLTALGKKQLEKEEASWARLTEGVARVLVYSKRHA